MKLIKSRNYFEYGGQFEDNILYSIFIVVKFYKWKNAISSIISTVFANINN